MPIMTPDAAAKLRPEETKHVEQIESAINDALTRYDGGQVLVSVTMSSRISNEIVRRLEEAGWIAFYTPPAAQRDDGQLQIARAVCERCNDRGVVGWGITESVCPCRERPDPFDR